MSRVRVVEGRETLEHIGLPQRRARQSASDVGMSSIRCTALWPRLLSHVTSGRRQTHEHDGHPSACRSNGRVSSDGTMSRSAFEQPTTVYLNGWYIVREPLQSGGSRPQLVANCEPCNADFGLS